MPQRAGRDYRDYPSEFFCLTVPKFSVEGGSFTVEILSGNEKVSIRGGGREYQDFPSKTFVSQCPNFSSGNSLAFHYFCVPKKFG